MTHDLTVILIGVAGIAAVVALVLGCLCYAHCRGDAEMGVADTQGRTNSEDAAALSGKERP